MSSFVGLADYGQTGLSGFGSLPNFNQAEIMKALEAGYVSSTGGPALKVESLEASLKVLTHTSKHIKFFSNVNKSAAYSTVEEYNQLTSVGPNGRSPFLLEGELPTTTDSSYTRKTELVKFLGTVREVTHPATLVNAAHGPLVEQNNNEGILWLLEQIERNMFKGDASLSFDGESESWNGMDALIDPASFLDLENDPMTESVIEEASQIIIDQFGFANEIYMGTKVKSNLTKTLQSRQRFPQPYAVQGRIGQSISHMETEGGDIALEGDVFLRKAAAPPASASHPNAPATPASITAASTATGAGDFEKKVSGADFEYFYVVTAANRFGESAPVAVGGGDTMTAAEAAAGNELALTITNAGSIGSFAPEYFRVYRTEALASGSAAPALGSTVNGRPAYSLVLEVATDSQTASVTTSPSDVNFLLPNTSIAYLGQNDKSVLTMRQLAPLMKMDLAVLGPAYRWMLLYYGTPILFAPKKWIRIINIGGLS